MSESLFKPVVLVTGCGSGIGLALAELLYKHAQYRVVITARAKSLPHLQERFPDTERFWVRPLDVMIASERARLIEEIATKWNGVNILVNNAGVSYRSVVEHMSAKEEQHQFDTNYFGPVALIRAVLPHMRKIGRGKIINVSSVSGMLAMPTMGSYSASKYALEGISEALWYEVRPLGINVSLIQPGFVRSKSFLKVQYSALSDPEHGTEGLYADYYEHMTPFIERLMGLSLTTPAAVAKKILRTIRKRNPALWIPATMDATIFYYLRRFVPRRILLELLFATLPRVRHWAKQYTNRRKKKKPRQ
ncbi:MAG: oxidoreductase [Bdellovibrionales bacterium CG10_big_fil_rev_8_21_14_0_10_45_34]|nr:MAG: oxidoreductase [Bdellovibrionales bacterium CG10_big_fil_rev_8_21_14_0_10_45_34]